MSCLYLINIALIGWIIVPLLNSNDRINIYQHRYQPQGLWIFLNMSSTVVLKFPEAATLYTIQFFVLRWPPTIIFLLQIHNYNFPTVGNIWYVIPGKGSKVHEPHVENCGSWWCFPPRKWTIVHFDGCPDNYRALPETQLPLSLVQVLVSCF